MDDTQQAVLGVMRGARGRRAWTAAAVVIAAMGCARAEGTAPLASRIGPEQLAVIVNDADPLSRRIAGYYRSQRHIPADNMIHLRFAPGATTMARVDFERLKAQVDRQTPPGVQAYALTWAAPYRVECMSITTAFALGYNSAYCAPGCRATRASPYFDSNSRAPQTDLALRPTMAIAALDFAHAKALIDRGVAADNTFPRGTGYLVSTTDRYRNVRAPIYPAVVKYLGLFLDLHVVTADSIAHKDDVLFYFTGSAQVANVDTNHFLPGAVADHLTSTGGQLTDSHQMSSLRWLEAGATGSYGAVVEPCNFPQKFPNPGVLISRYLQGETLLEAYWKSVAWPGQGIFIGEPLAAPFYRSGPPE
jgi:uncharacterized protein (TIGR03790 family)